MKEKRFSDLVIGVVFMALGLTVFLMANQLQTVKLGIGPAGFPKFIAVLLALLGAVMTVSALRHGVPKPQFKLEKKPTMLFLAAVALCVLYVILVPTVGFMLLTPFLNVWHDAFVWQPQLCDVRYRKRGYHSFGMAAVYQGVYDLPAYLQAVYVRREEACDV